MHKFVQRKELLSLCLSGECAVERAKENLFEHLVVYVPFSFSRQNNHKTSLSYCF